MGCNKTETNLATNTEHVDNAIETAPSFSYEEEKAEYTAGTEGVKTEGFKNTEKTKIKTIQAAIEHALKERTVGSDSANVFYDSDAKVCKVAFYSEGVLGDDQQVYFNKEGKTILIVYGE